jgi:hypothetical protein
VLVLAALRRRVLVRRPPKILVKHAAHVRVEQRRVFGEVAAGERALHDLQTSIVEG